MEFVRVEHRDRVAVITLVDEKRRNAMTLPMVDEICAALDTIEADDDIGAIVVTGAAPAFCSGADVSSLGSLSEGREEDRGSITSVYQGFLRFLASPLPTVAAVNGPAVGAGMNLALACDVRIAGESARFDPRFLKIGLHPGGGHTWMLQQLVGPQTAAAMVLFGEAATGPRAVEIGLAWQCVTDDALLDTAIAFAARAAALPRPLTARTKATMRAVLWQPSFDDALATEVAAQTWSLGQGWFPGPGKSSQ